MPIVKMQLTAAGPGFVMEAGKIYSVASSLLKEHRLCDTSRVIDCPGQPNHGKTEKCQPAAMLYSPKPKDKVLRLPAQPDPEDVPPQPDEDELTQDEREE